MEPDATPELPALATQPQPLTPAPDPHVVRIAGDVSSIMDRAYLELASRVEPKAFLRFAADVLRMKVQSGESRAQTVVNVVNAIPRSPLDGLPPGFTVK
jgi:hypothetical protein